MKYTLRIFCILLALLQGGCASIYGTFIEPESNSVYVGTRMHAQGIAGIISDADQPSTIHGGGLFGLMFVPFLLIDASLSFVADTFFIPYTVLTRKDETTEPQK
jgi:uncharacterized protein YceK